MQQEVTYEFDARGVLLASLSHSVELLYWDHPALKAVCSAIPDWLFSPLLQDFSDRVLQELRRHPDGVGLASSQVGVLLRLFILLDEEGKAIVACNPTYEVEGKQISFHTEGCLSMPGAYASVPRWDSVVLHYRTPDGEQAEPRRFTGLLAHAVQHEIDHLDGEMFFQKKVNRETRRDLLKKWERAKKALAGGRQ